MLTLQKRPNLVSAVFNPIEFKFSMSNYGIGDMFYLEVYHATGYLMTTLVKNGDGLGNVTFDISSVLQSIFTGVSTLNENLSIQRDNSAMAGYTVRAGKQVISGGVVTKIKYYQTDMLYALRAALPLDTDASLETNIVATNTNASFLTLNPCTQPVSSNIWLPLIVVANCTLKYCYSTNLAGTVSGYSSVNATAGLYVFNAKPEVLGLLSSATDYTVWVELEGPIYRATRDYTAICGTDYRGQFVATASYFSTISQTDANTKALQAAQTIANANIVCVPTVGS